MKKYLYQFMVALFAISSFTLVACSNEKAIDYSDQKEEQLYLEMYSSIDSVSKNIDSTF